jgi:hypothetical protein
MNSDGRRDAKSIAPLYSIVLNVARCAYVVLEKMMIRVRVKFASLETRHHDAGDVGDAAVANRRAAHRRTVETGWRSCATRRS